MLQAFDGHAPLVHPEAWVHPTACLIGQVELHRGASVWPMCVLRGDMERIVIGEDTNIQDATVCHTTNGQSETLIGARCTVGHRVILHGCIVEDEVLVGMGAILLDNCRIGEGSVIGAGAVVTGNKVIPPGSLVLGVPGRVVREVTESDRQRSREAWKIYRKKADRWRTGG